MELTTAQYIVLMLAGVTYGFAKTGITGVTAILVPLMLTVFTPGQALGIAVPMLIFADMMALVLLRRSVRWRIVLQAVPWAMAGVLAGWRVLAYAKTLPVPEGDDFLRRLVGGIMVIVVVAGVVVRLYRARRVETAAPENPSPSGSPSGMSPSRYAFTAFIAVFAGCVTMIANNSGPAWVLYLMLFGLDKYFFLGTAAWLFAIQNIVKVPFVVQLGYTDIGTLHLNLYMIPFTVLGVILGRWVVGRVSQKVFDNTIQVMALMGALYLLF